MTGSQTDNIGSSEHEPVTIFGPDFPFPYDDWLSHPSGLGSVPENKLGTSVAIVGAGMAGITAAYELMKMGLNPVVYESRRFGGRLHSEPFKGAEGVVAELGAMRIPQSSTAFNNYLDRYKLETRPFPNPLAAATPSTVIDLESNPVYVTSADQLPPLLKEVEQAWNEALESDAHLSAMQDAIRRRDVKTIKQIWDELVPVWDDRSFYGFIATSEAFKKRTFQHLEAFGQVGFGTGGWDTDFPNTMLEILRVVYTDCEENQSFIVGGVEQVPRRMWKDQPANIAHWPQGTSLDSLHRGAPRAGVKKIERCSDDKIRIVDKWGDAREYDAVLITCQSWAITTNIDCDESLFSPKMWMAMDRTRYMQSAKTFVMVDRPFWKEKDPATGRDKMSMTLTDRLTRGTYFFDLGDDKPGVICLTYSWMGDAMKMLPLSVDKRVELALSSLRKIYPHTDIEKHIIGDPITVSWEDDPHFLGAFKGALPGHYRYNRQMYCHFMQDSLPKEQRGVFIAGDDVGWIPGWVEGAVQSSLNAVWGIVHQLGGTTHKDNPGPGDRFEELQPVKLPD